MQNGETTTLGPGSVIFEASNDLHGLKNVGDTPASYYVIKWFPPGSMAVRSRSDVLAILLSSSVMRFNDSRETSAMAHDSLNPDNDPFGPPAISTVVHCIHCGEEYDSYRIEWRIEHDPDGKSHGFWCCPMPRLRRQGFRLRHLSGRSRVSRRKRRADVVQRRHGRV